MRLPGNKSLVRRFTGDEPVEALFAMAWEQAEGAQEQSFDLFQAFPRVSLLLMAGKTLKEASLLNSSIILQFLD
jgi:hypothetical protein